MRLPFLLSLVSILLTSCFEQPDRPNIFEEYFKDLEEIRAYFKEKNITDVDSTQSGLFFKILRNGNNVALEQRGVATIEYTARTLKDVVFIDTYPVPGNLSIILGTTNLQAAMVEGLQIVGEGGIVEVYSPSIFAYGERGFPPYVGKFEPVIYKIEIISIRNPPRPPTN
jgi:FKBP-type peptidyl-prolyl cis-trans isomerase FkpA